MDLFTRNKQTLLYVMQFQLERKQTENYIIQQIVLWYNFTLIHPIFLILSIGLLWCRARIYIQNGHMQSVGVVYDGLMLTWILLNLHLTSTSLDP